MKRLCVLGLGVLMLCVCANAQTVIKVIRDDDCKESRYDYIYQKDKIEEILKFIEVKDINTFSLREFIRKIQLCKLISTSIDRSEFSIILNQIKDIIYIHGGAKFLFNNDLNKKGTIDLKTFIKLLKDKSSLSVDKLKNAFFYIVKTSRDMSIDDYNEYFVQKNREINTYEEPYFINMMKKIIYIVVILYG